MTEDLSLNTERRRNGIFEGISDIDDSLLFFFLILVLIFTSCDTFNNGDDSLLFFFLLLVLIFTGDIF